MLESEYWRFEHRQLRFRCIPYNREVPETKGAWRSKMPSKKKNRGKKGGSSGGGGSGRTRKEDWPTQEAADERIAQWMADNPGVDPDDPATFRRMARELMGSDTVDDPCCPRPTDQEMMFGYDDSPW